MVSKRRKFTSPSMMPEIMPSVIPLRDESTTLPLQRALDILKSSYIHEEETVLSACARLIAEVQFQADINASYLRIVATAQRQLRDRIHVDIADNKGS